MVFSLNKYKQTNNKKKGMITCFLKFINIRVLGPINNKTPNENHFNPK